MTPSSRLTGEVPALTVLALTAAGLIAAATGAWRVGLWVVAAGCLLGALLRLVLPTRRAGLLAVRSRAVDVIVLGGFGAAVLLIAAAVPAPVR